jgi:photosystem II stability/assembly factor-like uncharacterized protein
MPTRRSATSGVAHGEEEIIPPGAESIAEPKNDTLLVCVPQLQHHKGHYHMTTLTRVAVAACLLVLSCRDADTCQADSDCGSGLICRSSVCVREGIDGGSAGVGGGLAGGGIGGGSSGGGGDTGGGLGSNTGGGGAAGGGLGGGGNSGGGGDTGGGVGGGETGGGGAAGGGVGGGNTGGGGATGGGVGGGNIGGGGDTGGGVGGGETGGGGATGVGGGGGETGGGVGGGVNLAPVPTTPALAATVNADEGQTSSISLIATDAENDALTYALASPPSFVTLSGNTVTVSPLAYTEAGSYTVNWSVTDGSHAPVTSRFTLIVRNTNRAPTLQNPADVNMTAGTSATVSFVATDLDGDALTFTISPTLSYGNLMGNTLTLTPPIGTSESVFLTVTATDGTLTSSRGLTVRVNPPANQAPTLSLLTQVDNMDTALAAGATITATPMLRATLADPDGDSARLEVEVVETTASFTNTATAASVLLPAGVVSATLSSLAAGQYKWQARAVDSRSNASAWVPFAAAARAFTIVQGNVTGSLIVNGGLPASNASVTLSYGVSTAVGASVTEVCLSNDMTFTTCGAPMGGTVIPWTLAAGPDGMRTVSMRVRDNAGQELIVSSQLLLDRTPPTGTVVVNGNQPWTNSDLLTLTLTSDDGAAGSGVTHACVKLALTTAPPTAPAPNDPCFVLLANAGSAALVGADGNYGAWVYFRDGVNLVSAAAQDTFGYDTTAPVLSAALLNNGAAYTNQLSATFNNTLQADLSGPAQVCTGTSSPPTNCIAYALAPVASLFTGPSQADGSVPVHIQVVDNAGNRSAVLTRSIIVDRTRPTVSTFTVPQYTNQTSITATVVATDGTGSGVALKRVTSNNGTATTYSPTSNPVGPIVLTGADGSKALSASSDDVAGNTSLPFNVSVMLDTVSPSAPTASVVTGPDGSGIVTYTITYPESLAPTATTSGLERFCTRERASMAVSLPPLANDPCFGVIVSPTPPLTVALSAQGTRVIEVWLLDRAGNVSPTPGTVTVVFDTTPPSTPTFTTVRAGHRSVALAWTASTDTGTGVTNYSVWAGPTAGGPYDLLTTTASTSITLTLPNESLSYIAVAANDGAGNQSPIVQTTATPRYPFAPTFRLPPAVWFTSGAIFNGTAYFSAFNGGLWSTSNLSTGLTAAGRVDPMTDNDVHGVSGDADFLFVVGQSGHIGYRTATGAMRMATNQDTTNRTLYGVTYAGTSGGNIYRVAVGQSGRVVRSTHTSAAPTVLPSFAVMTSGTTAELKSVAFCSATGAPCNASTLVAVGASGTIIRSTDHGATWATVVAPTGFVGVPLTSVVHIKGTSSFVAGADTGFSAGTPLMLSTNGGATWSALPTSPALTLPIRALSSESSSLPLRISAGAGATSQLAHLTVLSGTPTLVSNVLPLGVSTGLYPVLVSGVSSSLGALTAAMGNGGNVLGVPAGTSNYIDYAINSAPQFTSMATTATCAFAYLSSSTGQLYQSTSTLVPSWTSVPGPSGFTQYYDLAMPSSSTLIVVGNPGKLAISTNANTASPTFTTTTIGTASLQAVTCASTTNCVATGDQGTVLSYDGSAWSSVTLTPSSTGFFRAAATVVGSGSSRVFIGAYASDMYLLSRTGTTTTATTRLTLPSPANAADIVQGIAASQSTVIVGTSSNVLTQGLWRSTDNGTTWARTSTAQIANVVHLGGTVFLATTNLGTTVLRSEDDGLTWTSYPLHQTTALQTLRQCMPAAAGAVQRVFAVGINGAVFHSLSGGKGG